MKIPKISIIVPVYNVSKYLNKCLDSIVNQSLKEIEIIIVNDCSPDPIDDKICREYEELYGQITYLKHKKNEGLGKARNTGMSYARGEFLGFIDSDDYIHCDMYKIMYEKAIENDCDFVQCNTVLVDSKYNSYQDSSCNLNNNTERLITNLDEKIKLYFSFKKNRLFINPGSCNKIIKRSVWVDNHINFVENTAHEDIFPILKVLFYTKRNLFIREGFYYYYYNPNSITRTFRTERIQQTIGFLQQIQDFLKEKNIYDRHKKIYMNYRFRNIMKIYALAHKLKQLKGFSGIIFKDQIYTNNWKMRLKIYLIVLSCKMNIYHLIRMAYRVLRLK